MFDVAIVGAGPVGLYLAALLLRKGLRIVILDKSPGPWSKPCSGLVSERFGRLVRLNGCVERRIAGAVLSNKHEQLKIRKRALLIDRFSLHSHLAEGVDVEWGRCVGSIKIKKEYAEINRGIKARLVVGADGVNSVVARHWGIRHKTLTGIVGYTREEMDDSVHVWLVRKGFFWRIPRKDMTEYGMLAKRANLDILERFFRKRFKRTAAGLIPCCPVKSYFERTLLVGDAAGQVRDLAGGGLVWGMLAARIAADIIVKSVELDNQSAGFLSSYERGWQALLGLDIKAGLMVRKMLSELKEVEIEQILKILNYVGIDKADMDFPFSSLFDNLPFQAIMYKT